MQNTASWVDTGFLVTLFAKNDKHHTAAVEFLRDNPKLELHSIWPVIVEACFFLDLRAKTALMTWLERGAMNIHDIRVADLSLIRNTLEKYHNIEPDFTDAALVTLAELTGIKTILTIDVRDFSIYRFSCGSAFTRLWI